MRRRLAMVFSVMLLMTVTASAVFAKPLRLIAPQAFGLSCTEKICVEEAGDLGKARDLVSAALAEVETLTGQSLPLQTMVLCSTAQCYRNFGGGQERAISFPWLGTVVSGPDWQDYIIRHELVHWLQFQRFGAVETMSHPIWFREGMAYALSGAPDFDIPDHYQPMISRYRLWQGQRSADQLWDAPPEF